MDWPFEPLATDCEYKACVMPCGSRAVKCRGRCTYPPGRPLGRLNMSLTGRILRALKRQPLQHGKAAEAALHSGVGPADYPKCGRMSRTSKETIWTHRRCRQAGRQVGRQVGGRR
eukprot:6333726-Amphidinium_carterae.1